MDTQDLIKSIAELPSEEDRWKEAQVRLRLAREEVAKAEEELKHYRADARKRRQVAENSLIVQWRTWLYEEYGSNLPVLLLNKIYDRAWEAGHANGYAEVESEFQDLCDLAREARYHYARTPEKE